MAALNDRLHDRVLHFTYFEGPNLSFFRLCEAVTTTLRELLYCSTVELKFYRFVVLFNLLPSALEIYVVPLPSIEQ